MLISEDEGETWIMKYKSTHELNYAQFCSAQGRIIGFDFDILFELKFENDKVYPIFLNNEGIKGKWITSISYFNQSVWLTTLEGLYTIPLNKL